MSQRLKCKIGNYGRTIGKGRENYSKYWNGQDIFHKTIEYKKQKPKLHQIKSFSTVKETINTMRTWPREWEKYLQSICQMRCQKIFNINLTALT
jgi:hypothetical protein